MLDTAKRHPGLKGCQTVIDPDAIKRIVFALLGLVFLVAGENVLAQAPESVPMPPASENQVALPKNEVAVEPKAADRKIAQRLNEILLATDWFIGPSVEVREGVVFMDGEAREESHRKWAGDLARNTQDVVAVVNRIAVQREVAWNFEATRQQLTALYWQVARTLPLIILGLAIFLLSGLLAKLVAALARRTLKARIPSPLLMNVVARSIAIPVFLLGLYIVLYVSDLTRLALTILGGTGIVGLVLGFAFRDIAENFLASLFLSLRNPFRTGDYISVDGSEGVVQNLNTRSTVLLTLDGNHIQIPNAIIFKNKITNYSSNPYRRAEFSVGIGYDASIGHAQEIIVEVLKTHVAVLNEPEPLVLVDDLAASTVNLTVFYWFDSTVYSPVKIRSSLLRLTKRALLENGVSMPDDAREVIFPMGVPIIRQREGQPTSADQATQPAPFTPDQSETTEGATAAEGHLTTDEADIKVAANETAGPESEENLLQDRKSD